MCATGRRVWRRLTHLARFQIAKCWSSFFLKGRRPTAERLAQPKSLSPRCAADLISLPVVGQHIYSASSSSRTFYPRIQWGNTVFSFQKNRGAITNSFRHIRIRPPDCLPACLPPLLFSTRTSDERENKNTQNGKYRVKIE